MGGHFCTLKVCVPNHLATLLLGHLELGLGVGRCVGAASRGLGVGFLTDPCGLIARLHQHLRAAAFGLVADLVGGLASRRQHARHLLAEQTGQRGVVEIDGIQIGVRLGVAQLALEEPFAFLETAQLRRNHPQEVAHLTLIEAAAAGTEGRVDHRCR
jgi:hypothetical protein